MRLQKDFSQIVNQLMALTIVTKIGVYDSVYIFTGFFTCKSQRNAAERNVR